MLTSVLPERPRFCRRTPSSRRATGFIPRCHPAHTRRRALNTNTSAGEPSNTWPRGTFIGRWSLAAVSRAPFGRLVDQVMSQEPYRSARRVFWIADNGSSHRGARAAEELRERHPRIVVVHTPVHASWLNQIELYFSIIQRKVLTPNHHANLKKLEERIMAFGERYSALGKPFAWTFTRDDLERRLRDPLLISEPSAPLVQVA